jgi:dUTP pyrophosphatase
MLKVYCKDKNCYPEKAHYTDAGADLKAVKDYELSPNTVTKIHTGIYVEIPHGYAGFIYPRSGLSTRNGLVLANTVGVIDSDYRGEIICAMKWIPGYKLSNPYTKFKINKYDRIAQLVVTPIVQKVFIKVDNLEDLSDTKRGDGGFGHTGT